MKAKQISGHSDRYLHNLGSSSPAPVSRSLVLRRASTSKSDVWRKTAAVAAASVVGGGIVATAVWVASPLAAGFVLLQSPAAACAAARLGYTAAKYLNGQAAVHLNATLSAAIYGAAIGAMI